jgi:hypothetical protein
MAEKHFAGPPKNEKEKIERKQIIKKTISDLRAGTIHAKDIEQTIRMEKSRLIRENLPKKPAPAYAEFKLAFDKIISTCNDLEKQIHQFKITAGETYKFDPKRWERFTTSYRIIVLADELSWLWNDFLQKDSRADQSLRLKEVGHDS